MKKIIGCMVFALVPIIGLFDVSFADPVISSASKSNLSGSVTINGSGFGTKSTASPVVWDNFEAGTIGADILRPAIGSNYVLIHRRSKYSNEITRANSTRSSLHDFQNVAGSACALGIGAVQSSYYFSFWVYYDLTSSVWSDNWKPWTLYGNNGAQPCSYIGYGSPSANDGAMRRSLQDSPTLPSNASLYRTPYLNNLEGQWIRYEAWIVQSTPNTANGTWQVWLHSSAGIQLLQNDSPTTRTTSNYWDTLCIGGPYNNKISGHTAKIYVDDVYTDKTMARVEIGNASTWAACTHRELQIPTAWSNNSLTFNSNRGSFTDGKGYLYVVDANGTVNTNGYPITIGSGSEVDITPPTTPTGASIVVIP